MPNRSDTTEAGAYALEAVSVSKTYADGTRALAEASLSIRHGETVALLGESGCGKSTLLRVLNGMVEPDCGEIRVAGQRVSREEWTELRRRMGYVPQDGGLLPHWNVERNVALAPLLLGWPPQRRADRVREVLELVGLTAEKFAPRFPLELSGGQRQRVALARALAADPDTVLLDEPFGALDAMTRLALQEEFRTLQQRLGKSVLLVTHDLDEAFRIADAIAVMKDGEILRTDSPDRILAEPEHPYVAELLELHRAPLRSGS